MYHISSSHLEGARAGESEGGKLLHEVRLNVAGLQFQRQRLQTTQERFEALVMRDAFSPKKALATATETGWISNGSACGKSPAPPSHPAP